MTVRVNNGDRVMITAWLSKNIARHSYWLHDGRVGCTEWQLVRDMNTKSHSFVIFQDDTQEMIFRLATDFSDD